MKLLTKNTDYAIRALIFLAGNRGRNVPSREIAVRERVPLPFLRRILQVLREKGLLATGEGAKGGVRLRADPSRVPVIEVMRIFQGEMNLAECLFRRRICANRKRCPLRKRLRKIEEMVRKELQGITIASLLPRKFKTCHQVYPPRRDSKAQRSMK